MLNSSCKGPENVELSLFDPETGSREGTIKVDPLQLVGAGVIMFAIFAALDQAIDLSANPTFHEVVKKLLNLP